MKINNQNMNHWMNTQDGSEFLPGAGWAAKPSPYTEPGQDGPEPEAPAVTPGKPNPSPVLPPSAQAAVPASAGVDDPACKEASPASDAKAEAFRQALQAPIDLEASAARMGHGSPQQTIDVYAHPVLEKTLSSAITDEIKPYLPHGFLDSLPEYAQQLTWLERRVIEKAKEAARRAGMAEEELESELEAERRQELEANAYWNIKHSGIPARYLDASVSECCEPMRKYAMDFEMGESKSLVLRGSVGTGKTHGACAILRHLAKRSNVLFATMGGILREIRETYGNDSSEGKVIEKYAKAGVLVIDDFGKEKPTEWALSVMFEIIDARYRENRPTIFTTQYSSGELVERLAETGNVATAKAIVSRMSDCVSVVLDGPDRRLAG